MPAEFPKISIVTVSFNQGSFIEDNILSVINQNYPNVEHIIIDAGSTDGTLDILKKYDNYLNWTSEPDKGQSDGLNKGFKKATGEIIGWINSDDRLAPDALNKVAKFFFESPYEIALVGNLNLIDVKGNFIRTIQSKSYQYWNMINKDRGVTQPSTFFKKEVFEKIGFLDTNLHYAMDFEFFLRVSSLRDVPYINETLAEFRIQPNAKTTNGLAKFRKEHIKIARKYKASIFSRGILSDLYVIITEPLRRVNSIRNFIRKIKRVEPYNENIFNV